MLPRATENAVAGHIWPAGCYLPTPALVKWRVTEYSIQWKPLNTSTSGPADLDVISGWL